MLVLALEFSKDSSARGAWVRANHNRTNTGAYGAMGRRASRARDGIAGRGTTRRSFPQNGRAKARYHDLLEPVADGLPAGSSPKGDPDTPLREREAAHHPSLDGHDAE